MIWSVTSGLRIWSCILSMEAGRLPANDPGVSHCRTRKRLSADVFGWNRHTELEADSWPMSLPHVHTRKTSLLLLWECSRLRKPKVAGSACNFRSMIVSYPQDHHFTHLSYFVSWTWETDKQTESLQKKPSHLSRYTTSAKGCSLRIIPTMRFALMCNVADFNPADWACNGGVVVSAYLQFWRASFPCKNTSLPYPSFTLDWLMANPSLLSSSIGVSTRVAPLNFVS